MCFGMTSLLPTRASQAVSNDATAGFASSSSKRCRCQQLLVQCCTAEFVFACVSAHAHAERHFTYYPPFPTSTS